MIVRGRLIGALVCGVKKGSQTYAPDEREALEAMAHSVGNSIDGLRIRTLRQAVAGALSDATAFEAAREALARLARDDGFALA
jgi:GAF domain-containing protein